MDLKALIQEAYQTAKSKGWHDPEPTFLVAVEGRLQIRNYETQDGQKRKAAEIVSSRVQFFGKGAE